MHPWDVDRLTLEQFDRFQRYADTYNKQVSQDRQAMRQANGGEG